MRALEEMLVKELRNFRAELADMIEDLDLAIVGEVPEDMPDAILVKTIKALRRFRRDPMASSMHMLVIFMAASMNLEGAGERVIREGLMTREQWDNLG